MIHMAWPIAGVTWFVFQAERMWDDFQVLLTGIETRPRFDSLGGPV
jgi:hypothetical protein